MDIDAKAVARNADIPAHTRMTGSRALPLPEPWSCSRDICMLTVMVAGDRGSPDANDVRMQDSDKALIPGPRHYCFNFNPTSHQPNNNRTYYHTWRMESDLVTIGVAVAVIYIVYRFASKGQQSCKVLDLPFTNMPISLRFDGYGCCVWYQSSKCGLFIGL